MNIEKSKTATVAILTWIASFSWQSNLIASSPLLPLVKSALNLSSFESGLAFSLPLLLLALLSAPATIYTSSFSTRRVIITGLLMISTGGLLRAFSTSFGTLLIFSSIFGIGWALVYPNIPVFIRGNSEPKHAYLVTAIYSTGIALGSILASVLSIPVIYPNLNGWRGVYIFWGVAGFAATLVWLLVRVYRSEKRPTMVITTNTSTVPSAQQGTAPKFLTWRNILIVGFTFLTENIIFYSLAGWLPTIYFSLGWPLAMSSLLVTLLSGVSTVSALVYGFILVRFVSNRKLVVISSALCAVCVLGLDYWGSSLSWLFIIPISFTAIGVATICLAIIATSAARSSSSGIVISIGYFGGVIGPSIFGALRDLTSGFTLPLDLLVVVSVLMLAIGSRIK